MRSVIPFNNSQEGAFVETITHLKMKNPSLSALHPFLLVKTFLALSEKFKVVVIRKRSQEKTFLKSFGQKDHFRKDSFLENLNLERQKKLTHNRKEITKKKIFHYKQIDLLNPFHLRIYSHDDEDSYFDVLEEKMFLIKFKLKVIKYSNCSKKIS